MDINRLLARLFEIKDKISAFTLVTHKDIFSVGYFADETPYNKLFAGKYTDRVFQLTPEIINEFILFLVKNSAYQNIELAEEARGVLMQQIGKTALMIPRFVNPQDKAMCSTLTSFCKYVDDGNDIETAKGLAETKTQIIKEAIRQNMN